MNAIDLRGIIKNYQGFTLGPLEFSLPQGSILGLVGENGAGKSTTIRLIMNAISPDRGQIAVLGTDNRAQSFQALKNDIGVVLDEAYFSGLLNAKNVGALMADTYTRWNQTTYENYLRRFDLPVDKAFKDYSRGMRMKLAIAVALSHEARLLILDEATSGLDPMVRDEILDVFNDFTRDSSHSILLSSHIVSDLEKICDYIAFLHRGKLLLFEEKDRLLEEYALVRLTPEDFEALPPEAVHGVKRSSYAVEALVDRTRINAAVPTQHTSLEDIILFLARGEGKE